MTTHDPRAQAFQALLPLSPAFSEIVDGIDGAVGDLLNATKDLTAGWNGAQRAANAGGARFYYATQLCRAKLADIPGVTYFSTPAQELQNLYLWQVMPSGLGLRIKHDPSELSVQSSETLFDAAPNEADGSACFTWDVLPGGEGTCGHRFVAGHGAQWSIPLAELLSGAIQTLAFPVGGTPIATVRSARKKPSVITPTAGGPSPTAS